jgi:hypothetical protein
MQNVFAAFAVAPLGGALLVAVVGFLFALVVGSGDITGNVVGLAFIATALVGYAAAVVLGIPGFFLFRRLRWVRGAHWVVLCAVVGTVTGAIVPVVAMKTGGMAEEFWGALGVFLAAGAVIGAASGLLFARTIAIGPPRTDEIAATFD